MAPRDGARRLRRSAFATTTSDDIDIEIAATNGVTWPRIATGTATALYATASARFWRTNTAAFRATATA